MKYYKPPQKLLNVKHIIIANLKKVTSTIETLFKDSSYINFTKRKYLTSWIIILPIIGCLLSSLLFIKTFVEFESDNYTTELFKSNKETIKENKIAAREKVEEIFNTINLNTTYLKQDAKNNTKKMVYYGYSLIEKIYKNNQSLEKNEIVKLVINKLNDMRFFNNLDGYYYLLSPEGKVLMHPIKQKLMGRDSLNMKDIKGQAFIKKNINVAMQYGEGSDEYFWENTKTGLIERKYVYLKIFKPLNIILVTGRNEGTILDEVKTQIQNSLIHTKFGEKGYIFAYDALGNTISHINKDYIGKNRLNTLVYDEYLIKNLIKGAKLNSEGFFKSYVEKIDPTTKQKFHKTSYVKYIQELDWIIGTGVYHIDIKNENSTKKELLEKKFDNIFYNLGMSVSLILVIILLSTFFIFKKLRKGLKSYHQDLISDNEQTEKQKEQLIHKLRHDNLTTLPNRILLHERIEEAFIRNKRHQTKIALLFLDIDDFKSINDNHGHDIGDVILKDFALRLKSLLRDSDLPVRLSGDEFVILIEDIEKEEEITTIIKNIEITFNKPICINNINFIINTSIGISIFPNNGTSFDDLMKKADTAMYIAKKLGKNQYHFYTK